MGEDLAVGSWQEKKGLKIWDRKKKGEQETQSRGL